MNDQPRCRYIASDQPRAITGRHHDACDDEHCRGCLPCPMDHCRICGVVHSAGTCPGCMAEVRESIVDIVKLCHAVPAEAKHKGVESEAMILLAPTADPEAWGHVTASMAAGRVPADWRLLPEDWMKTATDEDHPLLALGEWEMVYRDAFEHPSIEPIDVVSAAAYLLRNLTRAGAEPWVAFEAMAKKLRDSRTYIERVLHDGEQVDTGAPCMRCDQPLTRIWATRPEDDQWECKRCREKSNLSMYRQAVKAEYIRKASWLTDVDMQTRTGVKASTVRSWASEKADRPALIRKTLHTERVVYAVADVLWIYACTQVDKKPAA